MNTFADKRIVNLSSLYGEQQNGSLHSIIDFEFPSLIEHQKDVAYVEVGIVSAEIPVSFYTINEYNNTLRIIFNSITFNMELVKGNYNATTLITEIRTKIDLAIVGAAPIEISLNRINGKLVWTNTSAIDDFTLVKAGSSLWYVLGLDDSVATYDANPTITPPFPLNLLGTNNVSIRTNNLATMNYNSRDAGTSNVLADIPVDASPFGILLYKNTSITYNILRVLNVNRFSISMLDDNNNPIDFNNANWTITLALNIHRHRPTLNTRTFSDMLDLKQPKEESEKKIEEPKEEEPKPRPKTLKDLDILTKLRFNN
tara:strand:- start:81 stop:1022 length:942 start_codon:yes stop_codon:yes gene_type:complete